VREALERGRFKGSVISQIPFVVDRDDMEARQMSCIINRDYDSYIGQIKQARGLKTWSRVPTAAIEAPVHQAAKEATTQQGAFGR
jgi:hypothetical protein